MTQYMEAQSPATLYLAPWLASSSLQQGFALAGRRYLAWSLSLQSPRGLAPTRQAGGSWLLPTLGAAAYAV